ncbi:unnamed protein product, partial [Meganyctiphanes norvegica]
MTAFIWFLSLMHSQMCYKIIIYRESYVTIAAVICFLPSVCHCVFNKRTSIRKSLVTMATFIWLLSCTCPKMFFKNTILRNHRHNSYIGMAFTLFVYLCLIKSFSKK